VKKSNFQIILELEQELLSKSEEIKDLKAEVEDLKNKIQRIEFYGRSEERK